MNAAPQNVGQQQVTNALLHPLQVRLRIMQCKKEARYGKQHRNAKAQQAIGQQVFHKAGQTQRQSGRCPGLQVGRRDGVAVNKHQQRHRDE